MLIKEQECTLPGGEKIIIRSATADDAESVCNHRSITSRETYFMARYPEECNLNIERMRTNLSDAEESLRDFMVTAFLGDQVVGDLGVVQIRKLFKYQHRAHMGISIQNQYCNLGLGSLMLQIAIEQARTNGFEQLELGVFEDNSRAIHLYEKHGFQKYGVQPRAFKLKDGSYRDEVIMVKML